MLRFGLGLFHHACNMPSNRRKISGSPPQSKSTKTFQKSWKEKIKGHEPSLHSSKMDALKSLKINGHLKRSEIMMRLAVSMVTIYTINVRKCHAKTLHTHRKMFSAAMSPVFIIKLSQVVQMHHLLFTCNIKKSLIHFFDVFYYLQNR